MPKLLLAAIAAIALTGCDHKYPPVQDMTLNGDKLKPQDRIHVELLGEFRDSIAYNSRRGVYIITDSKTGKEFIGVSGVGITESGSHMVGKIITENER